MKKYILFLLVITLILNNLFSQITISNEKEAVTIGINNSIELTELKKNALLKMKSAKLSIIPFLPKIDINWNEYDKVLIHSFDSRTKSINFSINQLLFDNGKTYLSYSANRYLSYLEYLEVNRKIKSKSLEIMETYYNIVLQIQLLNLKRQQLLTTESDLQIIEYKYKSGLAVKSDYLQYKIACQELKNEITKLSNEKDLYIRQLKNLMNISSESELIISDINLELTYSSDKLIPSYNIYEKLICDSDFTLKEAAADLEYQKIQFSISKHIYLPTIYLEAGLSFSGKTYPLTQPNYSFKLSFSFDNIPFINSNYSNGYEINNKRINSVSNSITTTINPDITYFTNQKITQSSLRQSEIALAKKKMELQNSIFQYLTEHDNLIDYISLLTEANQIQKEKLKINEFEYNNGLINSTDYLKEINNAAESEQKIIQTKIELLILQKKIEILSN